MRDIRTLYARLPLAVALGAVVLWGVASAAHAAEPAAGNDANGAGRAARTPAGPAGGWDEGRAAGAAATAWRR